MDGLFSKIRTAAEFIRTRTELRPSTGIILGTGLSGLAREMDIVCEIEYGEIPFFVRSTVESHQGKLIFGQIGGKPVVAMKGRFHYYEGYTLQQITFPVRVMKALGVETLLISNAAGCLNPLWKKGDLMVISDHINLLGDNPLIGRNDDRLGPRFPDMSDAYSKDLIQLAESVALDQKIQIRKGVYAAMTGPCLETASEYRLLRAIGADAIGMSTVPEAIVASHQGTRVFGISILTDDCFPDVLKPVALSEILEVAGHAEPLMTKLMAGIISKLT
ncbi:MAG: purine-nucleoside phosphorylase [Bacteroidetes bacterium]|nr:purine-nucleoside phosphorylase [Bacteroidota bacterium]